MIKRLCIVGVGLIGGSLAKDLRRLGLCDQVIGCSRKRENLERARELGIIDAYEMNPAKAVEGADMVVLAVPLGAMAEVLTAMAPGLDGQGVLTDVGSAKCSVLESARSAFGAAHVGEHTLARHLRVTVGLEDENARFLESLGKVIEKAVEKPVDRA